MQKEFQVHGLLTLDLRCRIDKNDYNFDHLSGVL